MSTKQTTVFQDIATEIARKRLQVWLSTTEESDEVKAAVERVVTWMFNIDNKETTT